MHCIVTKLTLVALLLDFKGLREILIRFPDNWCSNRTVIHEIACVADLFLIQICLLEHGVCEEIVRLEVEEDLEAGLFVLGG